MNKHFFYLFSNEKPVQHGISIKLKNTILSLVYLYLGVFVSVFIMQVLDQIIVSIFNYPSVLLLFSKSKQSILNYSFLVLVLIGPFFEELLFRLGLIFNKLNGAVFLSIITYLILGGKVNRFDFNTLQAFIILILAILSFFIYNKLLNDPIIKTVNYYKKYYVIISIVFFGLLHITNISKVGKLYWELALFYPFFTLPQIIMGYFITNLRLKYNFFWGVLLHISINLIGSILN